MRKVELTDFAKENLRNIYEYYKIMASVAVAQKIKQQIIDAIKTLKIEEVEWQEDEFLKLLNKNHRRLVAGNYKIIYCILDDTVYVTDIFDARQSPAKEQG